MAIVVFEARGFLVDSHYEMEAVPGRDQTIEQVVERLPPAGGRSTGMKTGKPVAKKPDHRCPLCGGALVNGLHTLPLVLGDSVLVVRDVPAEGCTQCGEPFLTSDVADRVQDLARRLREVPSEVAVARYASA